MRPFIGILTLLVAFVVAGCGSGGSDGVDRSIDGARVRVVSGTAVHLRPSKVAMALRDKAAVDRFLAPVPAGDDPDGRFADQVRTAIDRLDVASDETLYAQVVHMGCAQAGADTVTVERTGSDVVMSSDFTEKKDAECVAPVLTVALAAVPDLPGSPGSGHASSPGSAITPVAATVVPGSNAVRGPRDKVATRLPDAAAVATYAGRLAGPLPLGVPKAAGPLLKRAGTLYAQTVFDGCGTPPVDSLIVSRRPSGEVVISTDYRDPPKIACFVGVRSVALVVLP